MYIVFRKSVNKHHKCSCSFILEASILKEIQGFLKLLRIILYLRLLPWAACKPQNWQIAASCKEKRPFRTEKTRKCVSFLFSLRDQYHSTLLLSSAGSWPVSPVYKVYKEVQTKQAKVKRTGVFHNNPSIHVAQFSTPDCHWHSQ